MPRRKRSLASRIRGYVRGLLAFLFNNVGVVVLVLLYTMGGAFMFQAIEGASEMDRVNLMAWERNSTAEYLWQNVTLALNIFNETALKERIGIELNIYQRKVVVAIRRGWDGGRSSRKWSFSASFLYSLTVITTIGYGHLCPRTSWGKILTILYALIGMPLFLLYLNNVGDLLARWCKCLYALICLCRGCPGFTRQRKLRVRDSLGSSDTESLDHPDEWGSHYLDTIPDELRRANQRRPDYLRSTSMPQPANPRLIVPLDYTMRSWTEPPSRNSPGSSEFTFVTFDAQTITVPISVCMSIMVGYVMFGSVIFGKWEDWDQLNAAYFCFISLSSIGFGDFVPGERVYTPRLDTSFIVCSLYLMLGMALVAMCFNLMQEQVIHYFGGMKRALIRISRCKR